MFKTAPPVAVVDREVFGEAGEGEGAGEGAGAGEALGDGFGESCRDATGVVGLGEV